MTENTWCTNFKKMMELSKTQNLLFLDYNSPRNSGFLTKGNQALGANIVKIKTACKSDSAHGVSCRYDVVQVFHVQFTTDIANSFIKKATTTTASLCCEIVRFFAAPKSHVEDSAQNSFSESVKSVSDIRDSEISVFRVTNLINWLKLGTIQNLAEKDVKLFRPKLYNAMTKMLNQKIKTLVVVLSALLLHGKSFSQTIGDWPNPLSSSNGNKTYTLGNTFGVGTATPKAWAEVLYCPQSLSNPFPGLIVTSTDACMGGGTSIGGAGTEVTDGIVAANGVVPYSLLGITQNVPVQFPAGTGYHTVHSSSQDPLFIARIQRPFTSFGKTNIMGTEIPRFIIWPDGNTGINTATPRAALDVVGTLPNKPVAIFGVRSQFKATKPLGNLQLDEYYSKHIDIYSQVNAGFGNPLTQAHDVK